MMNFQAECKNRNACRVAKVEIKWDFGGILIRSRIGKFGIFPYPGPNPGQFMSLANLSSPRSDSATFSGTHLIFCIIPCMPACFTCENYPTRPRSLFANFIEVIPDGFEVLSFSVRKRPYLWFESSWVVLGGENQRDARRFFAEIFYLCVLSIPNYLRLQVHFRQLHDSKALCKTIMNLKICLKSMV